ncbi:immunoglobulin-like domain-containing protein [Fulvivirga lutea]|uniref:DUF5011 domain-containing protein n=1 Tax=Fulvivirga lutea TaxID=2810512 RepID=A0A974ZZS1_9BACT|nr:immunoglobulin-like domain-containing protein [Fulvivirga lutea]QSE96430.1 DUF5011 domain-containing protein [Fulvivirga lutea]
MRNILNYLLTIPAFAIIILFAGCGDEDENLPQVIAGFNFELNENSGTVTFENTSENADSYLWDFGDETTSTDEEPTKTYGNGTYIVNLTALNSAGASNTFSDTISVVVKKVVSLPITFDDTSVNYEAYVFSGASFEVVANPDESGSNNKSTNVGAIINSGAEFEGVSFDLGNNLNLETERSVTMSFWSDTPIDVLAKLEGDDVDEVEATESHGGTGWEVITFDFSASDSYSIFTLFADGPGTTAGTFYFDDVIQSATVDTTPPVITLNGDATVAVVTGEEYVELGAIAIDNIDGDISGNIIIDNSALDINTEGSYEVTYNVTDAAGNAADEVIRTVIVSDADLVKPVITLSGDNPFKFITGDTFNDPGATAADNIDGDITGDIVVSGNVDANTAGTYTLTYNVSDAAGNAADPVTREVVVGLVNGDFQTGDGTGWFGNALDVRTDDGTEYYTFANPTVAGAPFDVNLSQEVNLVMGQTYTLSFEASSDRNRTIVVGLGQNFGDFEADTTWLEINDTPTMYSVELTTNADDTGTPFGGDESNRLLFDMGADVGVVVIDKVSLSASTGGGSGGGGGGGDPVDGNLIVNPGFEDPENGIADAPGDWLFFNNGGTVSIDNTENNGGSNSAKIEVVGPGGNPGIKKERFGIGTVQAGDVVQISFDHKGTLQGDGGVFGVLLFVELGEGEAGDPITVDFGAMGQNPTLSADWTTYTQTYTIPGGSNTNGGLSLLIQGVCGPAGCGVTANIDNVSIVLNP